METQIIPPIKSPTPKPLKMPRIYPAQLDPSCVLYYDFSEGPQLYDFSGHLNHGVINGATFVAKGRDGTALKFDGLDDYVDAGDISVAEKKIYTYVIWVSTTQVGGDKWLISEGSTTDNIPIVGIVNQFGLIRAYMRTDSNVDAQVLGSRQINDGKWYMLSMVVDNIKIRAYVNGKEEGNVNVPGGTLTLNTATISALRRATVSVHAQCTIDNAKMFNKALTANEILRLYEAGR